MTTTLFADDFAGSGDIDGTTPETTIDSLPWSGSAAPLAISLSGGYAISTDSADLHSRGFAELGDGVTDYGLPTAASFTLAFRTGTVATDGVLDQLGVLLALTIGNSGFNIAVEALAGDVWRITDYVNFDEEFAGITSDTDYTLTVTIANGRQTFSVNSQDFITGTYYDDRDIGLNYVSIGVGKSFKIADLAAVDMPAGEIYGTMPAPVLNMDVIGNELWFAGTMPSPTLAFDIISGPPIPYIGAMPRPTLKFEEAGFITGTMPQPTLTMTVETIGTITFAGTMPRPTVDFRVETIDLITFAGTMPRPTLLMEGGAEITGSMPRPTLDFTLDSAGTGAITGSMPRPALDFRVLTAGSITFAGTMPSPVPGPYGEITGTMPRPRLDFSVAEVTEALYEAYALNLKHRDPRANDELTRYTNFPFVLGFIRYKGVHFGLAADGVYPLTGTTDDGDAIPFAVKTGVSDLGSDTKKTPVSMYLGGRIGPNATVKVFARDDDDTEQVYDYSTPADIVARNYRQKLGRGLKARYLAFGLEGSNELALDTLGLEIANLKRRL